MCHTPTWRRCSMISLRISSLRDDFYENVVAKADANPCMDDGRSFEHFMDDLKGRCSNWPSPKFCPLLIAIDEVHFINTPRISDNRSDPTLYSLLASVLNEAVMYPFVVISLLTATRVSSLAPSIEIAPSMRGISHKRKLPPPFTELPFDVLIAAEPLARGQATVASVGSLEFTAKFGQSP